MSYMFLSYCVAWGCALKKQTICLLVGVEEHCAEYQYVEQRHGWEAEQKRLNKEQDKHGKQAAKVGVCVITASCPLHTTARSACCLNPKP